MARDETTWTWWTLPPAIAGCLARMYHRCTKVRARSIRARTQARRKRVWRRHYSPRPSPASVRRGCPLTREDPRSLRLPETILLHAAKRGGLTDTSLGHCCGPAEQRLTEAQDGLLRTGAGSRSGSVFSSKDLIDGGFDDLDPGPGCRAGCEVPDGERTAVDGQGVRRADRAGGQRGRAWGQRGEGLPGRSRAGDDLAVVRRGDDGGGAAGPEGGRGKCRAVQGKRRR